MKLIGILIQFRILLLAIDNGDDQCQVRSQNLLKIKIPNQHFDSWMHAKKIRLFIWHSMNFEGSSQFNSVSGLNSYLNLQQKADQIRLQ